MMTKQERPILSGALRRIHLSGLTLATKISQTHSPSIRQRGRRIDNQGLGDI